MQGHVQDYEFDTGPRAARPGTERFCAVTGTAKPVAEMIRFVIGPGGSPVADLKRRLPGRGIWITATRQALAGAVKRKVFARSFKREIAVAPDFVEATERLLEQAVLDGLAIARKAGKVAIGYAKVEAALREGAVVARLEAADGASDGARKLGAVLRRRSGAGDDHIPVIQAFASAQLDLALGRSNVVHAALLAGPESETVLLRTGRLAHFRTGDLSESSGHRNPDEHSGRIGI